MKSEKILMTLILLACALVHTVSAQVSQIPVPETPSEDMVVFVSDYYPSMLRSDLLEDSDIQIYARLRGFQVNPFISIPVITRVSLHPSSQNKNVNVLGVGYMRGQTTPSVDDLGLLVVTIKRIPAEKDIPNSIDLNISAIIEYSFQDSVGFGKKDMVLDVTNDNAWNINQWQYEFWDNSGFLRLNELTTDQKASIILYDSTKHEIGRLQLSPGSSSTPYFININGKQGWVIVTLNSIQTPSPYARVAIEVNGKKIRGILRQNYPLYAGSSWKVASLESKVGGGGSITIRDSSGNQRTIAIDTRTINISDSAGAQQTKGIGDKIAEGLYVGWITDNNAYIINTSNADNAISKVRNAVKINKVYSDIFADLKSQKIIQDSQQVSIGDSISGTDFKLQSIVTQAYSSSLDNADSKRYFDAALGQYDEIASGLDVAARSDTEISVKYNPSWIKTALWEAYMFAGEKKYYQAKGADYLRALIARYPSDPDVNTWQSALDKIVNYNYANSHTYIDDRGITVSVLLEAIETPELTSKAGLIVSGIQGDYNEGSLADPWYVEQITNTAVIFRHSITNQKITINVGSEQILNQTSGFKIKVLSTEVQKEAYVTVSPYSRNGRTTTNFTVNVGIEKRAIQLTPEQINDQINSTDEQIKWLEKFNADTGNVITGLRNTCFATYGVLTIKNLVGDWSGAQGKARSLVMRGIDGNSGWIKICEGRVAEANKQGNFNTNVQKCLGEDAVQNAIKAQTADMAEKLESAKALGSFFDENGNIADSTKLKDQFTDPSIKSFIENQAYMADKFGAAQISRNDVEKLYLYQQMSTKEGEGELYAEAKADYDNLVKKYSEDNTIISSVQKTLPKTADSFSKLQSQGKQTEITKRQALLRLAKEGAAPAQANVEIYYTISPITVEDGMYKAYIPALVPTVGVNSVTVIKEGNDYYYYPPTSVSSSSTPTAGVVVSATVPAGAKKIKVVQQSGCAGEKESALRIYDILPYKGLPARVPFSKGWAEVTQYENNNPKQMTIHLTNPLEDGTCEFMYNFGQDFNVFEKPYKDAITSAKNCILIGVNAVKNKKQGDTYICEGKMYSIGSTYTPKQQQTYCEDVFSAADCTILYNVCDPVMCPASRCDFGGRFHVDNVIQSGIFGSIMLCAPNFPTPVIAACLPGIRAGLLGYESMLKSYKSCLQTQLQTGQTVGICDRIRSLYICDLAWKTVLSVYNLYGGFYGIMSRGFEKLKGGGEYVDTFSGLQEAEKSFSYFTSVYAEDVVAKFKNLKAETIGGYVCQRAIYGTVPTNLDIFADISKAEAPPQFFGHVEESAYATVDVPRSHYKVYYHIYSGEASQGIYYRIYLSSPITNPLYPTPANEYVLDSGYLGAGAYVDKSPDLIAQSGYRQLCIDINGAPHCGFGWVSSEAVVQELTDMYTSKLASSDIKSESECIFSKPAIVPVVGAGIEGTQLLQRRGINRICTSGDPNSGSGTRTWSTVGYCDQKAGILCWQDDSSVQNAIKDLKIEQQVLTNAQEKVEQLLQAGYSNDNDTKDNLDIAYKKYYLNGEYDKAITFSEQIIRQASPLSTYLIDEARFIIGLSYERLFEGKKKDSDKQKAAEEAKAKVAEKKPETEEKAKEETVMRTKTGEALYYPAKSETLEEISAKFYPDKKLNDAAYIEKIRDANKNWDKSKVSADFGEPVKIAFEKVTGIYDEEDSFIKSVKSKTSYQILKCDELLGSGMKGECRQILLDVEEQIGGGYIVRSLCYFNPESIVDIHACVQCAKANSCADFNNDLESCKLAECTKQSGLECKEDFVTKNCIDKGISVAFDEAKKKYAENLQANKLSDASDSLIEFIKKYSESGESIDAANMLYTKAQGFEDIGRYADALIIYGKLSVLDYSSIKSTVFNANSRKMLISDVLLQFDSFASAFEVCGAKNSPCKCNLARVPTPQSTLLGNYILMNKTSDGIALNLMTRYNYFVKSKAISGKRLCYFKSKIDFGDMRDLGYSNYDDYILSLLNLNANELKLTDYIQEELGTVMGWNLYANNDLIGQVTDSRALKTKNSVCFMTDSLVSSDYNGLESC